MRLQVLVAAMHQNDYTLPERMNIQADVVVGNQCDRDSVETFICHGHSIVFLNSSERGVGRNRNNALRHATGDILLFADEDVIYYDSALQGVVEAFERQPKADVILFGLDMTRQGIVCERRETPDGRVRLWNSLKYGTCRIAVRGDVVRKHNLCFSHYFGGGCLYGSGEDSLFLRECFRKRLRIYSHSLVLGTCANDTSTWFTGYNEKLLFDKGAWIACAFPRVKHIIKWYFVWRFAGLAKMSWKKVKKLIDEGIKAFPDFISYDDMFKVVLNSNDLRD